MRQTRVSGIRLFFSFILAFVLTIMPLPDFMMGIRPPWVLLLLLYIEIYLPNYFSVILILFLGFCLDVLLPSMIGEHAFALLLTTRIISGKVRILSFISIIQQMVLVALLCFTYQFIIFLIDVLLGYRSSIWVLCSNAFLSLLIWPWIRLALIWTLDKRPEKRLMSLSK